MIRNNKIELSVLKIKCLYFPPAMKESIINSSDSIHSYINLLSYFDQNTYLTTIDINKNSLVLDKKRIIDVQSHYFISNSLITFHKNGLIKVYNIDHRFLLRHLMLMYDHL